MTSPVVIVDLDECLIPDGAAVRAAVRGAGRALDRRRRAGGRHGASCRTAGAARQPTRRERHELRLATDGCLSLQRAKLRLSGLADRFHRVFASGELGHPKGTAEFTAVVSTALTEGRTVFSSRVTA